MDYKTLSSLWQQGQSGLAPEMQDNFGTVTLPDGTQIQRTGDSYNLINPGSKIGSQYQQYGSDGSVQNLISKHSTGLLDRIGDTLPVVVPAMIGSMTAAGLMGGFSPASGWVSAEGGAGYAGGMAADAGGLWGSNLLSAGLNKAIGTGLKTAIGTGIPAANGNTGITGGGMAANGNTGIAGGLDLGSIFGGLFNTGLDVAGGLYSANNVADVANTSANNIKTLAQQLADKGKFTPYNVTSSVGSVTSGPNGINTSLSPQMQAIQNGAFGRVQDLMNPYTNSNVSNLSNQAYGQASDWLNKQANPLYSQLEQAGMSSALDQMGQKVDPTYGKLFGLGTGLGQQMLTHNSANPLYAKNEQAGLSGANAMLQKASGFDPEADAKKQYDLNAALYAPQQQQQNTDMENRLAAQGRLGLSYGSVGAAPELAALKQAQYMQNLQNSVDSRGQAFQRQNDLLNQANTLQNFGINAGQAGQQWNANNQNQALGLINMGMNANAQGQQWQMNNQQLANSMANLGMNAGQNGLNMQKGYFDLGNGLFNMGMKGDQFINDMNASRLQQAGAAMGIGMKPQDQLNTQIDQSLRAGQAQSSAEMNQARLQADLGMNAENTRYKGAALSAAIKNGMIGSAISGAKGFLNNGGGAASGVAGLVQNLLKSGVNPQDLAGLLQQSGLDISELVPDYGTFTDNFDMGNLEDWANSAGDWSGAGDMDWDWF